MSELLFLLLPIAAVYGWYMGRHRAQQDQQQQGSRLSRNYVTGVNFLLSNQQDKAVNLFLNMLKDDSDTLEAHLTLGNIFRSRGEVNRAIHIHQSLMENPSLSRDQHLLAVQQLGRDYMAAGMYDRAETKFIQLIDETDFRINALQQLLWIYQATSDWQKAIDVASRLVKLGKNDIKREIAHFFCELALLETGNDSPNAAMSLLKKAESTDRKNARVSIMLGRLFIDKGNYYLAVDYLQRVFEQDKELVYETLEMLEMCFRNLEQPQPWIDYLKRCVEENTGALAELYLADIYEQQDGMEAAQIYINRQLQRHPTMLMFHRLMNFHLNEAEDGRAKESLMVLCNMVGEQLTSQPRYRCKKCGFTANTLHWHCPSCRSWSSVKPIRGLNGQ